MLPVSVASTFTYIVPIYAHGGHEHEESYGWSVEPAPLIGLLATAVLYGVLVVAAHRRGTRASRLRVASFGTGLVVIGIALFSPIDPFGESRSPTVHMIQHELLLMVAPLLLILGLEQRLVLPISRLVLRPVRSRGWRAVLGLLGNPWFAVAVWTVVTLGWHIPALYDLALENSSVHILEHTSLMVVGLLFWAVMVGRIPAVHHTTLTERIVALAGAMAAGGLVGALLLWSPTVLYAPYAGVTGWFGMSALADQHAAGAVMMAIDMPLLLAALLVTVGRAMARLHPDPLPPTPGEVEHA